MIRRGLIVLAGLVALAGPVRAAGPVDRVLDDLNRLGYGNVTVERTLLGRTRILASNDKADREIIIDPRTGEILRDLWTPKVADASADRLVDPGDGKGTSKGSGGSSSGSGSSGGSGDDEEHDDGDGGDDDGGKSGQGGDDDGGGSNSGSGGSGSGDDGDDD